MIYDPIYATGTADFEQIRKDGCVYVDKTEYIWKMTRLKAPIFLSRPRRFGKSLLTRTLECYFKGKKELFEGLKIAEYEKEWTEYPVLRFDLSDCKVGEVNDIVYSVAQQIAKYEALWSVTDTGGKLGDRMKRLIHTAVAQTGRKVVILIDEYDAPLNSNIDRDADFLDAVRSELRSFFGPIKSCEEDIRFAFLTGITRYSQMGIFSELNNLKNISMLPEYAGVCGITKEELETVLWSDVERMAQRLHLSPEETYAKLKYKYDGYHTCKGSPDIFSPFSLINAFSDGDLHNYWFGSATPTMLVKYLKKMGTALDVSQLDGILVKLSSFDIPIESAPDSIALLYQSGYLTIKEYIPQLDGYVLGVPNNDVRIGLSESLLPLLVNYNITQTNTFIMQFQSAVFSDDMTRARTLLEAYLAGIHHKVLKDKGEHTYHAIFYTLFSLLGFAPKIENGCARGYSDMIFETPTSIYCMEFKVDKSAEAAIQQIIDKGYLRPYAASGKRLVMVGVSFSTGKRNIENWVTLPYTPATT